MLLIVCRLIVYAPGIIAVKVLAERVNEDDREAIWEEDKRATIGKRIVSGGTSIQM